MTIAELIQQLKDMPQNWLVIMSKDSEGNRFSPLSDVSMVNYEAETTWSGDLGDAEDSSDLNAVCLWTAC